MKTLEERAVRVSSDGVMAGQSRKYDPSFPAPSPARLHTIYGADPTTPRASAMASAHKAPLSLTACVDATTLSHTRCSRSNLKET